MPVVYLIGSLRNENIPKVGAALRSPDLEVFDDWFSAGEYADDALRDYYRDRKFPYQEILDSYAAKHIFSFDKYHLDRCTAGVLVMPAGKSGHLELGYLRGQGKPCFILFDKEPERVDIMHQFADGGVFFNINDLKGALYETCVSRGPNARNPQFQLPGV